MRARSSALLLLAVAATWISACNGEVAPGAGDADAGACGTDPSVDGCSTDLDCDAANLRDGAGAVSLVVLRV